MQINARNFSPFSQETFLSPLPEKRHSVILDQVARNKFVSIVELGRQLDVTRETIRNDISLLAKKNLLQQVRGGATHIEKTEAALSERENLNYAGKLKIAEIVADVIPDKASVIIDSGSTTQIAARALAKKSDLTIYTNDLAVAVSLVSSAREVHVLGGKLGRSEHATTGLDTLEMLSNYRADYSLIGVGGLSADHGFTDFNRVGAKMRDEMISLSTNPLFLADHEKFNKIAPVKLMNANGARFLVTDRSPDSAVSSHLVELSLEVLTPHSMV
ncbi:MAG: DeoR family transcriptional regulator [Rhizobiaceae bacterium]|nr:DeoR family transcriptional regulator [Rhizobiaceae bacterium]